ncbi:uncharacterized protein LOC108107592 [Drosophila eugracilis]|uniref:uncharacterized protein LOC108107592 n=1 Tax=Drosophila eugracilis TaxID=29029 RepID=UPI0007E74EC4|nr:uncharacterized protein LOC108107592 [Drosophila eugracilis]
MIDARTMEDESKFQEPNREISMKVFSGEYRLLRRKQGSSVWKVYREIVRSDGAIINGLYFCTGCKRVMRSFNTTNLRAHKCHVDYLRSQDPSEGTYVDMEPQPREQGTYTSERRPNYYQPPEWSYQATDMLLELWAAHCRDLRDSRRRVKVIWKMTVEMKTLGFTFTEIKNKLEDMAQQYRREAHIEKTTGEQSKWEYFESMKTILTSEHNLVEDNARNGLSRNTSLDNSPKKKYIKTEDDDYSEDQEESQEDVDELRVLKDNIIREIEESSTVRSQENFEDELDQQTSKNSEIKRAKRKRTARMMEIEEEKLVIEKKKFKLMNYFVREMSSFHKSLFDLLSSPKKGSKS